MNRLKSLDVLPQDYPEDGLRTFRTVFLRLCECKRRYYGSINRHRCKICEKNRVRAVK